MDTLVVRDPTRVERTPSTSHKGKHSLRKLTYWPMSMQIGQMPGDFAPWHEGKVDSHPGKSLSRGERTVSLRYGVELPGGCFVLEKSTAS